MNCRKQNIFLSIGMAILGLVLFSSCFYSFAPLGATGSVVLKVSVPQFTAGTAVEPAGRFIHPDTQTATVTVTSADMTTVTETKSLGGSTADLLFELYTVPSGDNRMVTISLHDVADILIAEGSTTIQVVPNRRNEASITAKPTIFSPLQLGLASPPIPQTSAGKTVVYSIDISLDGEYIVNSDSPLVLTKVYSGEGAKVSPSAGSEELYTLSAGKTYYIAATLPDDYAGGATVKIKIFSALTTLTVTVSFENPMEPEFSISAIPDISAGGTLSLTAAEGFTSYEWTLNGVVQTLDLTNVFTRVCAVANTPELIIPGLNTLTLIVGSSGDYYSAEFTFMIIQ